MQDAIFAVILFLDHNGIVPYRERADADPSSFAFPIGFEIPLPLPSLAPALSDRVRDPAASSFACASPF